MRRDGLAALTLRAIAREAGVSHAAPAHHFKDLAGLLTQLATIGFERFAAALRAAREAHAGAHAYVNFAMANPDLFLLMFRSEKLDASWPALKKARGEAFALLAEANAAPVKAPTLAQLGAVTAMWSLVHGFSLLLIDGRLKPLLKSAPAGTGAMELLDAVLGQR